MSVLTFKSDEYKTFPQVLRDYASYVNVIKGNSEKTVCEYLLDLRTFFRFYIMKSRNEELDKADFEKIDISKITVEDAGRITPQHILEFLMYASFERENTPTTRMRKLSALKSFYHYLYGKKHLVSSNPTTEIDSPKKGHTLPKYMNTEEAVKLLETVSSDDDSKTKRRDFAIIALFLNTGMRLSELVGLNIKSFDSELVSVKVKGKGNKERVIYLNDISKSALRDYLEERLDPTTSVKDSEALFISRLGTRISTKTVQWMVYKYLDLAGLGAKGLSTHKLRHTAATLMYQSGNVDIRVLKDILGHEQLNTTQIYTHVIDRNIENAVKQNPLANLKIKK